MPRKWYTPIAEYSAIIDLGILKSIDIDAYDAVSELAEGIISSYVNIGVFDRLVVRPSRELDVTIRIGYKIVQGKSKEEIAKELGITQYKVKQHLDDLCSIAGVNSRKEIKRFILNNITI